MSNRQQISANNVKTHMAYTAPYSATFLISKDIERSQAIGRVFFIKGSLVAIILGKTRSFNKKITEKTIQSISDIYIKLEAISLKLDTDKLNSEQLIILNSDMDSIIKNMVTMNGYYRKFNYLGSESLKSILEHTLDLLFKIEADIKIKLHKNKQRITSSKEIKTIISNSSKKAFYGKI